MKSDPVPSGARKRPLLARVRPSRLVRLAAAIAAAAILAVTAADIYTRHQSNIRDAQQHIRGFSIMLSEQIARTFEAADRTLQAAAEARVDFERGGAVGAGAAPYEMLKAILGGSHFLSGISWVDADGNRLHASTSPNPPPLNVREQEQFKVHRDRPNVGLFISHPFRSVLDGRWLILVSRRFDNANGGFGGIVQAALDIDYLDRTYKEMDIAQGMIIALYRNDGTILIRTPNTYEFIGKSVADSPNFDTIFRGAPSGFMRGVNVRDGRGGPKRIGAFHAVPGLPLVAVVSVTEDGVLQRWQNSIYLLVPAAFLLVVIVLAGGFLFARQLARNERQALALVAANARAKAAQDEALRASHAKSSFLASMSHELRTPLNSVIGFGQMLQTDPALSPKQRDYAQSVLTGGYHLLNLVNEVLDLAGIEAGKLKMTIEPVNVAEKLESVRRTLQPLASRQSIPVEIAVDPAVADVDADRMRLRQVLLNLVSNAIKYNRPGGRVRIAASVVPSGRTRITVEDTGPGIAPERQVELFQPFARLGAEHTATEGTGLGLAIARQLVEAMEGTLGFSSTPNIGSRFWIELPTHAAAAVAAAAETESARTPAMPRPSPASHSILYIDDNPEGLRMVTHLLSTRADLAVLSASMPQAGLDLAFAHRPDVIILDLNLPGMSGYEVLTRLRSSPETRAIPVIAFTAAAMPSDITRGREAGFFRYLTKPIDVNAFFQAISDAIAVRSSAHRRDNAKLA